MVRLLIFIFISLNVLAVDMTNSAITLYEKGEVKKSIKILKEISPSSSYFKRSLETLAKIYYRENMLNNLFGVSMFYRTHFHNHKEFLVDIVSLEVLALAKLCHYKTAQQILDSVKKDFTIDNIKMKALEGSFKLTKEYGLRESTKFNVDQIPNSWKLSRKEFFKLTSPYSLVVKLENLCQK
jgi:hypothetical protein